MFSNLIIQAEALKSFSSVAAFYYVVSHIHIFVSMYSMCMGTVEATWKQNLRLLILAGCLLFDFVSHANEQRRLVFEG